MYFERLKERYRDLMDRQSRLGRLAIRLSFLALVALFLSTVVPTMAQDLGSTPVTQQDPSTPTTPTGPTDPATPSDSATVPAPSDSPSPAPSDSPSPVALPSPLADSTTASPEPVHALKDQPIYTSHVPALVNVDPRAVQMALPSIAFSGSKYTLACISSDNLRFDILGKRVPDPSPSESLLVAGDLSSQLRISGLNGDVANLINSIGGLTAYSTQGGIAGKSLYIRYVAMSGSATDLSFCAAAQSGSLTTFRALDLGISNAGGKVTLKR
jgi:hypothetical protein